MKGLTKHLTTLVIFCSILFANAQNMGSIRFHVWSASGLTDECILYINPNATTDYEGSFDAIKFFSASYKPQVFSVSTDSVALSYNAFPPFQKDTIIPIWFKSSTDTLHSIMMNYLSMDSSWTIELNDSLSPNWIDLTTGDSLYFQHEDSVLQARFMLHIGCDVELILEDSICANSGSFTLYGNNYENGRFFGDAVINDSVFDPSMAVQGLNWVYFESFGCEDVDSSWIYFYPSPSLILSPDTSVVPGGIAQLNASLTPLNPHYQYSWSPSHLVVAPFSLNTMSLPLSQSTTFTMTVSDTLCGPGAVGQVQVIVIPLQASSSYPTAVCSGTQVYLCANVSGGTGNYSISWSPDSLFNDPDSLCSWVWLYDSVSYGAVVSDGNESVNIIPDLSIWPLPEVSWDTSFRTCFGQDVVLTPGTPPGGEFQSFQMQDSLFLSHLYPAGDYPVVYAYQYNNNCWNWAEAMVTIEELLPEVEIFQLQLTIDGQELESYVDTSGNGTFVSGDLLPEYSFQWYSLFGGVSSEIPWGNTWNIFIPWMAYDSVYVTIRDSNSCERVSPPFLIVWWSIDENDIDQIDIYPNPSRDYIEFDYSEKPSSYEIYDLYGRQLLHGHLEPYENKIDIRDLGSGHYILELMEEGISSRGKFIKL